VFGKIAFIGFSLAFATAFAHDGEHRESGDPQAGTPLSFIRTAEGKWGLQITITPPGLIQLKPARIEVLGNDGNLHELAAGYATLLHSDSCIVARAEIPYGDGVVFHLADRWTTNGPVVSVRRSVDVTGNAPCGFNSSFVFAVDSAVSWDDVRCLLPGALYGDPTRNGERSAGGTLNHATRRFLLREDMLPAPMLGLSFANGTSVAMLDPSPRGGSTVGETKLISDVMIDPRFQFGAFGVWQMQARAVEIGFQYPGTFCPYAFGPNATAQPRWIRRFHPVEQGVAHQYEVRIRCGTGETFRDLTRNAWRWAWETLKPQVIPLDVDLVRWVLTDHLAAQAATIDGRTAIPFAVATFDTNHLQWNWTMAAMGFVAKNVECADQLLREGDRDTTGRGRRMRDIGLGIIASMIRALATVPLQATGYDLATGKPWDHIWLAPWLRNATEDMRVLVQAYRRERGLGRDHPEWFRWVKSYVDWLVVQQRDDGSFPRRWKSGSSEVAETTGTTSYCPVPLLVMMSEETGDTRYSKAAVRAAEYVWAHWGVRGLYVGGASDNPNITDKEAGMLSLEAFLSLFESTKDPLWLERAKAAADYTESWIWIWNLPMPLDADDARLHWKKGVPTVGLQGITALVAGSVDEYLDWAAPSYAKLYQYTNDAHYLDVARILLHDTKSMVALPGRQYDMKGIGWQQEGWRMGPGGPGRGVGGHRFWLPWISANHLHSITGLEELDDEVRRQVRSGNPLYNETE
jgi:hypothetical protein